MHITYRITLCSTFISKSSQPYTGNFTQVEVFYIASVNSQAFDVNIVKTRWHNVNFTITQTYKKTISK